jgi:hypothetical protein
MLRITVTTEPQNTTVRLEGRLVSAWVEEFSACWGHLRTSGTRPVRIDLDGLTFIDDGGKAALRAMHADGAVLTATTVTMRAFVDDIAADADGFDQQCGARSPQQ